MRRIYRAWRSVPYVGISIEGDAVKETLVKEISAFDRKKITTNLHPCFL